MCIHHYRVPKYNAALKLKEGNKICIKCGNVKAYKTGIQSDFEEDYFEPETNQEYLIETNILFQVAQIVIPIIIFMVVFSSVMNILHNCVGNITIGNC